MTLFNESNEVIRPPARYEILFNFKDKDGNLLGGAELLSTRVNKFQNEYPADLTGIWGIFDHELKTVEIFPKTSANYSYIAFQRAYSQAPVSVECCAEIINYDKDIMPPLK